MTSTCTLSSYYTKVLLISFILGFVHKSYVAEARAVPRSNSRSFRFPSNDEEQDTFKDSSVLFLSTKKIPENNNHARFTASDFGRNAIITLDTTPIKASVPESPKTSRENENGSLEETLSSELIGDDLSISKVEDDYEKSDNKEDEALREALCFINTNATLTNSTDSSHVSKLRYDLQRGKCAEVGKQEHCSTNMIFVAEIDSSAYGYCECDFENKILRKEQKQIALFTKTPLVFHPLTNSCYRLYEQGYCGAGEWLVLSRKEKGPVCERMTCSQQSIEHGEQVRATPNRRRASKLLTPSLWTQEGSTPKVLDSYAKATNNGSESVNADKKSIWVPLNGSGPCVKLFERNFEHCGEDEKVVFNVGDIVPKCGIPGRGIEGRAIIRNACPPGSYYSIIGRCQPDWDF